MRSMMRCLSAASTAALVACGGDATGPSVQRSSWVVVGDWVAESVGGVPIPAVVFTYPGSGPVGPSYTLAVSRGLTIGPDGGWWADSTLQVQPAGVGAGTISIGGSGSFVWFVTDSVLHVARDDGECFCSGAMFPNMDFRLRSDGKIEARIDAPDGPLTVFRRQ